MLTLGMFRCQCVSAPLPCYDNSGHVSTFQESACAPPHPHGSVADPHFQLVDGYACRRCAYRTGNLTKLRRHLSHEHLLMQHASLCRANDLYDDVYLQT